MTRISIVTSWLCATGVTVVACYCILTHHKNTPADQERAEKVAARISRHGMIPEYKAKNSHSSAVKKTTIAKVTEKDVKVPTYIPNPLYPPFTNALHQLAMEFAELAKDDDVVLTNGLVLTMKEGKPVLKFPEAYGKVCVGSVAMGGELKDVDFGTQRKRVDGTIEEKVSEVGLSKYRRLDEPEFYCTDVTYSVLPATMQVDAIRMHGNLEVGNTSKAQDMVKEIDKWMKDDYGAIDQDVKTPAGALALKRYKIGGGMDVEVKVNWKRQRSDEGCDADIVVNFIASELVEEYRYQCQKLGQAADEARVFTRYNTGVNYYTVKPKVDADAVQKKVVY